MKQETTSELNGVKQPSTQRWLEHTLVLALIIVAGVGLSGCAETGGVGYSSAYYAPDYGPYYGDYGYDGYPYWGGGPYLGSSIIIGGRSHRGYYGGHHFAHDFRGNTGFQRSSFRGSAGGFRAGAPGGGGRRR
jgi:hypothetical protein